MVYNVNSTGIDRYLLFVYSGAQIVLRKNMEDSIKNEDFEDGHALLSMLRQTHDAILKIRQRELNKYDLTPEQAAAVMVIHALKGRATTAEISRRLFRESNSITVLVKRLEKRGFIKRVPDDKRRNIIRISLTEKGNEAYYNALQIEAFNKIIKKFSIRKRQQLWKLLEKLRNYALKDMSYDVKSFSDFSAMLKEESDQAKKTG
jgi:DNA-binding MarR family transcriptional regulator